MTRLFSIAATLAIAAGAPAQTVRLQLKFPLGRTDRMTLTTRANESIVVPGQPKAIPMKMDQTMAMLMRVTKSNAQGASLRTTYEEMSQSMSMNGQPMPQGLGAGGSSKALKGKSLVMNFSPDGRIVGVEGVGALKAALTKDGSPQTRMMIDSMFSEKAIRDMWSVSLGGLFPNRPLRVGESWNSNIPLNQGPIQMNLRLKMRLQRVENVGGHRVARISMTGTGSMDASGLGMQGLKMKSDRFNVVGASAFDMDRGWFAGQQMSIDAKLEVSVPGQNGKNMSIAMKMAMKTSVTPVR